MVRSPFLKCAILLGVLTGSQAPAVEPLITLEHARVIAKQPGKGCSNQSPGTPEPCKCPPTVGCP